MKIKLKAKFFFYVLFIGGVVKTSLYSLTPFDQAMEEGYSDKNYPVCQKFKKLYEQNHFEKDLKKQGSIPKHIHQIWIGGKDLPRDFARLAQTFQEKHPSWQYTLWTDDKLREFTFKKCKKAFDRAQQIGAKVDILRYEILYQFGGVYADMDFECVRPLDALVLSHDFFTSLGGHDYIANSLIGATAQHPLLGRLLDSLSYKTQEELSNPWYDTGPYFFTRQVYQYLRRKKEKAIVYPSKFFHPLPNCYRFDYRQNHLSSSFIRSFFIPETFAVHYWAESWR